ncbi:ABC transporter permease [Lacihabitans lacunae]|uniref:ABC transporter permease n=1 Tax=Lacihabitans lacunae TaxID=1028214 RepID=A0ABV7YXV5_9BACT
MFKNYFKIVFRNFARQPFYSFINVVGLSIGLAACWFLAMYFFHEKTYDAFLPNANRIAAVALDLKMGDMEGKTTNTPPPLGARLAEYPEIETTARTFNLGETLVKREVKNSEPLIFNESGAVAVDSTFLDLFGFEFVQGNTNALNSHLGLVLTETTAKKYFGNEPAIGKTLSFNDRNFTVSGVLKDLPSNSTLRFDFLLPTKSFRVIENFDWSWIWLQMDTWVKFKKPITETNLAKLEAKLPEMVQKYAPSAFEKIGMSWEDKMKQGDKYNVKFLPLTKLHLEYADIDSRLSTLGDGKQVKMFGIIGIIILLLACVNFINLSTARSIKRAKEVGVRKALGSSKGSLIGQFLVESSVFSISALFLATIITALFIRSFNELTGITFTISSLYQTNVLLVVLILPLLTGLVAGLYPAYYLSKFDTIDTMKKSTGTGSRGFSSVRSGLVVFQFTVSIVLMLGSIIVYRQLSFAQNSKTGIQKENVLVINNTRNFKSISEREVFRQKLLQIPEVKNVTHSTFLPSLGAFNDFYEPEQGSQANAVVQNIAISSYLTDENFVPTLKIELTDGRNFRANSQSDSASVILNETAVKAIGWKNPIGQWMRYPGNVNQRFQVVGVVKDFHLYSVRAAIEPLAIFHESSKTYQTWGSYMAVRLLPNTEKAGIEKISNIWKSSIPNVPFEYDFLDKSFARMYQSENQMASILLVFTALALFIGCLGLFALATFTAEHRTKEIGIRKVLGASVMGITALLSKDFLKLVAIALVIGSPVAWYFMNQWLGDFAYRIDIEWWIFALAGVTAILIAIATVSFQAIRAALMNPVKSLRSE